MERSLSRSNFVLVLMSEATFIKFWLKSFMEMDCGVYLILVEKN
jgi:hypothetical protein